MTTTPAEQDAMRRALALAATPGVPLGPNPRVGCVLLDAEGRTLAEGHHRGAGTAHAEVDALAVAAAAGLDVRGATAVVTLEPCDHVGRTGPCSVALLEAGVRRVVHAQSDANPVAAGGAARLRAAGVEVAGGLLADEARALNAAGSFSVEHGRPFVTWKLATSLDGRSAAADGTSRWVSGRAARRDTHRLRAGCDTMLVGTNTIEVDDPRLTVRDEHDEPLPHQPLRAVMGLRDLDPDRRVLGLGGDRPGGDDAPLGPGAVHLRTRDPHAALTELAGLGRHHVFLEGGPTLAAAFLRAGLVDEIVCYVAPVLLGAGRSAVADLGITTIAAALRPVVTDVTVLDGIDGEQPDVRLTLVPTSPRSPSDPVPREDT